MLRSQATGELRAQTFPKPCVLATDRIRHSNVPASVGELLAAGESHACRCSGGVQWNAAANAAGHPSVRPPAARSLDKCRMAAVRYSAVNNGST